MNFKIYIFQHSLRRCAQLRSNSCLNKTILILPENQFIIKESQGLEAAQQFLKISDPGSSIASLPTSTRVASTNPPVGFVL